MPKLNGLQWVLIASAIVSALSGATAQLTDLFGASIAHTIVSAAGLVDTLISAIMVPFVGSTNMAKYVVADGVTKIRVTPASDPALVKLAVDPNQPNIGAENPADRPKLQAVANG